MASGAEPNGIVLGPRFGNLQETQQIHKNILSCIHLYSIFLIILYFYLYYNSNYCNYIYCLLISFETSYDTIYLLRKIMFELRKNINFMTCITRVFFKSKSFLTYEKH